MNLQMGNIFVRVKKQTCTLSVFGGIPEVCYLKVKHNALPEDVGRGDKFVSFLIFQQMSLLRSMVLYVFIPTLECVVRGNSFVDSLVFPQTQKHNTLPPVIHGKTTAYRSKL